MCVSVWFCLRLRWVSLCLDPLYHDPPPISTLSFIYKKVRLTSCSHPSCDSPNTSRCFALGAGQCLRGRRKPDVLRPGIVREGLSHVVVCDKISNRIMDVVMR